MKNVLRWSLSILGTFAGVVYAAPVTPPAGSYIVNTSTSPTTFPIFSVSSGTLRQQLNLPYIASGNCLQTTTGGKVVSAGAACGSGGGGGMTPGATYYIQNSSTLQAGSTSYTSYVYVGSSMTDSGAMRILGKLDVGSSATGPSELSRMSFDPSVLGPALNLYSNGIGTGSSINFIDNSGTTVGQINTNPVGGSLNVTSGRGFGVTYGTSLSTLTVSNFANFTGAALSTFTYGVSAGSLTITGAGDGSITLTVTGSTYAVTATSSTNTAFHMAGWGGANNQLIDIGLPIAPGGFGTINAGTAGLMSYYNIAGSTLSAIPGTLVTATSVTLPQTAITSTMTVLVGAGGMLNTPASLNVYVNGDTIGQTVLFNVGSQQHVDQIYMLDKTWFYSEYGIKTNSLHLGDATGGNTKIGSIQSANQFIDYYNNGEMDLQTSTFANADIVLKPKTSERFRASFSSGIVNVGVTANRYTTIFTTNTAASYTSADIQVSVSTNGAVGFFPRTLAQMATIIPNKVGEVLFPIDATVDGLCVSTQAVTASWGGMAARTTACH